jgi:hypothetical protein
VSPQATALELPPELLLPASLGPEAATPLEPLPELAPKLASDAPELDSEAELPEPPPELAWLDPPSDLAPPEPPPCLLLVAGRVPPALPPTVVEAGPGHPSAKASSVDSGIARRLIATSIGQVRALGAR